MELYSTYSRRGFSLCDFLNEKGSGSITGNTGPKQPDPWHLHWPWIGLNQLYPRLLQTLHHCSVALGQCIIYGICSLQVLLGKKIKGRYCLILCATMRFQVQGSWMNHKTLPFKQGSYERPTSMKLHLKQSSVWSVNHQERDLHSHELKYVYQRLPKYAWTIMLLIEYNLWQSMEIQCWVLILSSA